MTSRWRCVLRRTCTRRRSLRASTIATPTASSTASSTRFFASGFRMARAPPGGCHPRLRQARAGRGAADDRGRWPAIANLRLCRGSRGRRRAGLGAGRHQPYVQPRQLRGRDDPRDRRVRAQRSSAMSRSATSPGRTGDFGARRSVASALPPSSGGGPRRRLPRVCGVTSPGIRRPTRQPSRRWRRSALAQGRRSWNTDGGLCSRWLGPWPPPRCFWASRH